MKKFFLALFLWISVGFIFAFSLIGYMESHTLYNDRDVFLIIFELCFPLAYIIALAIEGLLGQ